MCVPPFPFVWEATLRPTIFAWIERDVLIDWFGYTATIGTLHRCMLVPLGEGDPCPFPCATVIRARMGLPVLIVGGIKHPIAPKSADCCAGKLLVPTRHKLAPSHCGYPTTAAYMR